MSATFDSDMFAQYFALPVRDQLEPAPIVSVEGKPFQVREFYTEDLQALSEVYFYNDLYNFKNQGPVVQSIVSLTSSLRSQLVKFFMTLLQNTLIFVVKKK